MLQLLCNCSVRYFRACTVVLLHTNGPFGGYNNLISWNRHGHCLDIFLSQKLTVSWQWSEKEPLSVEIIVRDISHLRIFPRLSWSSVLREAFRPIACEEKKRWIRKVFYYLILRTLFKLHFFFHCNRLCQSKQSKVYLPEAPFPHAEVSRLMLLQNPVHC